MLECHSSRHGGDLNLHARKNGSKDSKDLKCDNNDRGKTVELKVGTEDNQHIVAVEPEGKGSTFALVFVQTRGKETI